MHNSLKKRVHDILENESGDFLGWTVTIFLILLIVLNVLIVVFETVEGVKAQYGELFWRFELFSLAVFTVEYGVRLWACNAEERFAQPLKGRLLYIITPLALVDLVAILPTWITLMLPIGLVDFLALRVLRLVRVFRVFKLGHYNHSLTKVKRVISAQKRELFVVAFVAFVVLIVASCLMYYVENPAQPDSFPNIPAAMWWGVETLTTIGYGDVVPITPLGKLTGSLIALMGVALFAIPAGILSFGFYEEFHKHQEKDKPASQSRFQCTGIADEIKKAAELRDSDILTQLEFEDYKKQLLRSANVESCGNLDNDRNN